MPSGGLLNLSLNSGAQDSALTVDPEASYFVGNIKRHTNFSQEWVNLTFNGSVAFGKTINCNIPRSGDMAAEMSLEFKLSALTGTGTQAWTRNIGVSMIKQVYIEIGNQKVDTQYGTQMHMWYELTRSGSHEAGFNVLIGNTQLMTTEAASIPATTVRVPLGFWFNKHFQDALPLVSLQFHETKVSVELRPASELYVSSSGTVTVPTLEDASLWVNYIYLSEDERNSFSANVHEYLIEEVQFAGEETFATTNIRQRLAFNHPVKEILFAVQYTDNVKSVADAAGKANRWTDFTDNGLGADPYNGGQPLVRAQLQVNGYNMSDERDALFYNVESNLYRHTRIPSTGIYSHCFALHPESAQPSGSLNFSRADTATLLLTLASSSACTVYTYARSINIGTFKGGLFGKIYAS